MAIYHSLSERMSRQELHSQKKKMRSPQDVEFHGALKKVHDCVKQYEGMRLWGWRDAVQLRILTVSA